VVGEGVAAALDVQPLADVSAVADVLPEELLGPGGDPVSSWVRREALVKLGLLSLDRAIALTEDEVDGRDDTTSACWVDLPTGTCVAVVLRPSSQRVDSSLETIDTERLRAALSAVH
ncbi:hypothetical protein ACFP8W_25365, partial [Nocardioides hankookensis]